MAIRGEQPRDDGTGAMLPIAAGCAVLLVLLVGLGAGAYFWFMTPIRSTSAPAPILAPSIPAPVSAPALPPALPEPAPTTTVDTTPTVHEGAEVAGALSADEIRTVIRRNLAGVRHCYEVALRTDPTLQARVTAHFVIGADGAVTSATVDGSDDVTMTTCIASRVRSWQFPAPRGGGLVTVNYPFVFSPG